MCRVARVVAFEKCFFQSHPPCPPTAPNATEPDDNNNEKRLQLNKLRTGGRGLWNGGHSGRVCEGLCSGIHSVRRLIYVSFPLGKTAPHGGRTRGFETKNKFFINAKEEEIGAGCSGKCSHRSFKYAL